MYAKNDWQRKVIFTIFNKIIGRLRVHLVYTKSKELLRKS